MIANIAVDVGHQRINAVGEIVVGSRDLAKINLDIALVRQLGDQLLNRFDRYDRVLIALQDQARRRAGQAADCSSIRPRARSS